MYRRFITLNITVVRAIMAISACLWPPGLGSLESVPEMTGITFIFNRMTLCTAGNLRLRFADLPSRFNYVRMKGPRMSGMP
jgi:hypothetical protein